MTGPLSIEKKGNAMAAIDQLVRAIAFPESGDVSYRLAARQLAVGSRDLIEADLRRVCDQTDPPIEKMMEIVDFTLERLGRT